jgi:hypothetical protein
MTLQTTGKIDKSWGYEVIFANNDKYCGKLLVFPQAGNKTNLILHKDKRKSWFVNAGKFKITFIDIATGQMQQAVVEQGRTLDFAELSPHQIESLENNGIIYEVSTADHVEDVINLSPSAAQTPPPAPQ